MSVIGICAFAGLLFGGFVPEAWGASALGLQSLLFGVLGGLVGVWVGVKLTQY